MDFHLGGDLAKYRFESDGDERELWGTALFALARAKFRPSLERTRPLVLRCVTSPRLPARLLPSGKPPGTSTVSPGLNGGYQVFERRPTKSGGPAYADSWRPLIYPSLTIPPDPRSGHERALR